MANSSPNNESSSEKSRQRWRHSKEAFREAGQNLWATLKKGTAAIVGVLAAIWFMLAAGLNALRIKIRRQRENRRDKIQRQRENRLKKVYRCPVCDRIPKPTKESDPVSYPSECDICHTNNAAWRSLSWQNHANRFPLLVRILIPVLLLFHGAAIYYAWRSSAPPFEFTIRAVAVLSLLASLVVVAMVFSFRERLRHQDLLRRVKKEGKGLSLVAQGGLLLALVLILLAGVSAFMFLVGDFIMGGSWTLSIQGLEGDP
ncbi:MAG TPA: hypothetical protein VL334_00005, partial [Anaerolineae bacterium]|nr:hypothetical protein [Anaerolineae bacterium]